MSFDVAEAERKWAQAGYGETVEIPLDIDEPEMSTEDYESMLFADNLSKDWTMVRLYNREYCEEVRTTLDALRGMGLKLAIGSSSKNTKFILSRIGLGEFFDAISDGTNITRSKPDPQVFQMAAQFLGLEPAQCLVVEDAEAGIAAAVAGGFDSAGLGEAAACGKATYAMQSFSDLLKICRE